MERDGFLEQMPTTSQLTMVEAMVAEEKVVVKAEVKANV